MLLLMSKESSVFLWIFLNSVAEVFQFCFVLFYISTDTRMALDTFCTKLQWENFNLPACQKKCKYESCMQEVH